MAKCEFKASEVSDLIRSYVKTRDAFVGHDLVCRITNPHDYPNRCPKRNKIQNESLELENKLRDAILELSKCLE